MSLKKGNIAIFVLFLFQKLDFTFSHVFWNQNFEPISSSHSNYIHSESKLLKNAKKTHVRTRFLNCPPADHPAFKLPVHVAHVGVGHMPGGVILLPPKPVEVATFPDTQSRQHMVLKKAVAPTAVQVGRAFQS